MDVSALVHSILEHHGDTLIHYASPYYDPVKAKEYYERTKQLKGRQGSAGLFKGPAPKAALSSTQRQAVGYANLQIANAKQSESKKLATEREAKLKATSERIKKKLDETIAKRADALLKRLENLPEDTDPEIIRKLMGSHSKNANKARQQASKELQSSFSSIRKSFATAREKLNSKYNSAKKTEESNIRAQVR